MTKGERSSCFWVIPLAIQSLDLGTAGASTPRTSVPNARRSAFYLFVSLCRRKDKPASPPVTPCRFLNLGSNRRYYQSMVGSFEIKLTLPPDVSEPEAKLLLAIKLFEIGKATLGQAANLAGLSKRAFIEMLGRYNVPVFNYSPDDLRAELGL